MKKIILAGIACLAMCQIGHAQTSSDIYMICTSTSGDPDEGVTRVEFPEDDNDPIYTHRPIFFEMTSRVKGFRVGFAHYNYNSTELRKERTPTTDDYMKIVIKPKSFYHTTVMKNPISMEQKLESLRSKEWAWAWADSLKGKRIYIFDNSDPMNWGEEGDGTTIRLIEVRLDETNEPISTIIYED